MKIRWMAAGVAVLAVAGCGKEIPDPFRDHLIPHAVVVSDNVDCVMGPEACGRDVVLRPVGESEEQLLAQVTAYVEQRLSWRHDRDVDPNDIGFGAGFTSGDGFDSTDRGGWVNSAAAELAYWRTTGYATGSQELATERAMADTPNGVFVEINGSTCGSAVKCQGG